MYRTGDLVGRGAGGRLEFLGRTVNPGRPRLAAPDVLDAGKSERLTNCVPRETIP